MLESRIFVRFSRPSMWHQWTWQHCCWSLPGTLKAPPIMERLSVADGWYAEHDLGFSPWAAASSGINYPKAWLVRNAGFWEEKQLDAGGRSKHDGLENESPASNYGVIHSLNFRNQSSDQTLKPFKLTKFWVILLVLVFSDAIFPKDETLNLSISRCSGHPGCREETTRRLRYWDLEDFFRRISPLQHEVSKKNVTRFPKQDDTEN